MITINKITLEQRPMQGSHSYSCKGNNISHVKGETLAGVSDVDSVDNTSVKNECMAKVISQERGRKIITTNENNILIAQMLDENGEITHSYPSSEELQRYQKIINSLGGEA